jgi:hypothetical protein
MAPASESGRYRGKRKLATEVKLGKHGRFTGGILRKSGG